MRKRVILLICALAALLAACHSTPPNIGTDATTESTGMPETTAQTETTASATVPPETTVPGESGGATLAPGEDTVPATETTVPTETVSYNRTPDNLYCAVYTDKESGQWIYEEYNLDTSGCVAGYLYAFDLDTADKWLVCDTPVLCNANTNEYVYYVLQNDPQTIIRSSFDGTEKSVFYEAEDGKISDISYYGGPDGMMGILVDNADMILYDLADNTAELLYSLENTESFDLGFWAEYGQIHIYLLDGSCWVYMASTGELLAGPDL